MNKIKCNKGACKCMYFCSKLNYERDMDQHQYIGGGSKGVLESLSYCKLILSQKRVWLPSIEYDLGLH